MGGRLRAYARRLRRPRYWRRPPAEGDASSLIVVYLVLLFAIPAPLIIGPLGAPGSPAALFSVGLLLYWALGRIFVPGPPDPARNPVRVGFFIILVATLASYAYGNFHGLDPVRLSGADRGLLSLLGWLGLGLVAVDLMHRVDRVERLLQILVGLSVILALVGILQFFTGFDVAQVVSIPGLTPNQGALSLIAERSAFRRVQATTSHPIELGVVVSVIIPLALHFAFNARTLRRRRVNWVGVAVLLFVLPLTISRSAVVGLAVGLIILFASWNGMRRVVALAVTPLILLATSAAVPGVLGTIRSLFVNIGSDDSIKGRTDDYAVIGDYISQSPIFGHGPGTFVPKEFFILDNQYLGTLVETGVLGLVALIMLFVLGIAATRGINLRAPNERIRSLSTSLTASVVVCAVSFATFDGFGFPVISGLLFLLLGLCGSLWKACDGGSLVTRIPKSMRRGWQPIGGSSTNALREGARLGGVVVERDHGEEVREESHRDH